VRRFIQALCILPGLLLASPAIAQTTASRIDVHIETAKVTAGLDWRNIFVALCLPATPLPPNFPPPTPAVAPDPAGWYAPPLRVFDNLYWLGTRQHSSWALQTSQGLIVIDTNFHWATDPEIVSGLMTLGLNPRDIKYVLISHAHGDHDQGAATLQSRYGARVVMGAADWEHTLRRPANEPGGVPRRDVVVGRDGMDLTLGDTTVRIVPTPGHTPGTLSYVFPVKNGSATLMAAYSGGTIMRGFGADPARWDEYIASQRRIARAAADANATVMLSNHSDFDGAYTRARLIPAARQLGEDHPFIVGREGVQRYFTVMTECAMAAKLRATAPQR
jgi:metallo-beta-lactamase class B